MHFEPFVSMKSGLEGRNNLTGEDIYADYLASQ